MSIIFWKNYLISATKRQVPCPVGRFNSYVNGTSIASCLPCTAGFYCLAGTITPTLLCIAGYYCPTNITDGVSSLLIGSYGSKQVPCPGKTYINVTGTKNESDCKHCPAGFYCPEGSETPNECPRGYYCPERSEVETPCPLGTYGNRTELHSRENCTQCDPGWWEISVLFIFHQFLFSYNVNKYLDI